MLPLPAQRAAPTVSALKKEIREHEELERLLYTALISDHIARGADIRGELWDYAEGMSGCVPDDMEDYGYNDD